MEEVRGQRGRRKLAELLRLTEAERREYDKWQYAGAHDALRLLLTQLLRPDRIETVMRSQLSGLDGKTLVDILIEDGPGAVVAIIDREQRAIDTSMRVGEPVERESLLDFFHRWPLVGSDIDLDRNSADTGRDVEI